MRLKIILFTCLIAIAFFIDTTLGTLSYPKMLIMVCAMIAIYECVSPYIYTPR